MTIFIGMPVPSRKISSHIYGLGIPILPTFLRLFRLDFRTVLMVFPPPPPILLLVHDVDLYMTHSLMRSILVKYREKCTAQIDTDTTLVFPIKFYWIFHIICYVIVYNARCLRTQESAVTTKILILSQMYPFDSYYY